MAKRVPIRPAKLPLASKAANTGNLHRANGSNLDDAQAIFAIVSVGQGSLFETRAARGLSLNPGSLGRGETVLPP